MSVATVSVLLQLWPCRNVQTAMIEATQSLTKGFQIMFHVFLGNSAPQIEIYKDSKQLM